MMLTWNDCLGLADLTLEEIQAIQLHEHLPALAALELGHYLVHQEGGCVAIKRMILDDIAEARARGDFMAVLKLKLAMKHFIETHRPELGAA